MMRCQRFEDSSGALSMAVGQANKVNKVPRQDPTARKDRSHNNEQRSSQTENCRKWKVEYFDWVLMIDDMMMTDEWGETS